MIEKNTINDIEVKKLITTDYQTQYLTISVTNEVDNKDLKIVSVNALATALLKYKSSFFDSKIDFESKLETLYNSKISIQPVRTRNLIGIKIIITCINENLTLNGEKLVDELIKYAYDLLVSQKELKNEDFAKEQKELIEYLNEANEDKKIAASNELQYNFNSDWRKVNNLGDVKTIADITIDDINNHLAMLFNKATIKINFSSPNDITELLVNDFPIPITKVNHGKFDVITLSENIEKVTKIEGSQSYLNIAFPITSNDLTPNERVHLSMLNAVLGGTATSKLFTNVREKHSLAYYAASKMQFHFSYFEIYTGIEAKNFELAKKVIFEQISDLRSDVISEEELTTVKKMWDTDIEGCVDLHITLFNKLAQLKVYGFDNIEDFKSAYQATTIADLNNVAKYIAENYYLNFWEGDSIEK